MLAEEAQNVVEESEVIAEEGQTEVEESLVIVQEGQKEVGESEIIAEEAVQVSSMLRGSVMKKRTNPFGMKKAMFAAKFIFDVKALVSVDRVDAVMVVRKVTIDRGDSRAGEHKRFNKPKLTSMVSVEQLAETVLVIRKKALMVGDSISDELETADAVIPQKDGSLDKEEIDVRQNSEQIASQEASLASQDNEVIASQEDNEYIASEEKPVLVQ